MVKIVATDKRQFVCRDYKVCKVKIRKETRFAYSSCNVALHPGECLTSYHTQVTAHFKLQQNTLGDTKLIIVSVCACVVVFFGEKVLGNSWGGCSVFGCVKIFSLCLPRLQ